MLETGVRRGTTCSRRAGRRSPQSVARRPPTARRRRPGAAGAPPRPRRSPSSSGRARRAGSLTNEQKLSPPYGSMWKSRRPARQAA
ncbi:MAG: hypothetical protein MZV64_49545 [Ignavibacteriales bacterium]|nr:hypothetical protein [Ignavibacteriales bacterium]